MSSKFLSAEWRKLAIANYAVDPDLLKTFLPYGTEPDTWNGKHYVSLVGFRFINTRLKGIPVPFHRHFEEVNLRFYVKRKDNGKWRRGITFIREIVPKKALSIVANLIYREKYITCPMDHSWEVNDDLLKVTYRWQSSRLWNTFSVTSGTKPNPIIEGSEEEFITEHYWGYTPFSNTCSSEYQVTHPKWLAYSIKNWDIDVNFGQVYGNDFAFLTGKTPDSVMLAEGSRIDVYSARKIK